MDEPTAWLYQAKADFHAAERYHFRMAEDCGVPFGSQVAADRGEVRQGRWFRPCKTREFSRRGFAPVTRCITISAS